MQLLIPPEISQQLVDALRQAGQREIGGILMGAHIGPDAFRVKEITIQRKGGTFAAFIRMVEEILAPLLAFFDTTKHDYTRFNYLGEWHSHHSFALVPSGRDHMTMYDIVIDQQLGAGFVVLLLVKLGDHGQLEGSVTVYQPNKTSFAGSIIQESSV
ncbi:MAG: Mov34/MPN/PAD-1 family protein [Coprothermobacterota bacterium]|nr:Mov34/MPN/PAD-1 family protein [Coprothermobacterota bacterium]